MRKTPNIKLVTTRNFRKNVLHKFGKYLSSYPLSNKTNAYVSNLKIKQKIWIKNRNFLRI